MNHQAKHSGDKILVLGTILPITSVVSASFKLSVPTMTLPFD